MLMLYKRHINVVKTKETPKKGEEIIYPPSKYSLYIIGSHASLLLPE
jgi:hypothetical protein